MSAGSSTPEVSALALHLLAAAITYLNTHLIQMVLRDPGWKKRLSPADRRGLTALFWSHLNLYGRFELDMNRHLELDTALDTVVAGPSQ
ncbi:Tn3 family transposase [Nonomuraea sp. NPDC050451]|uniref:Tn3 family transposase n=1 Tax=Nonomuraea sp. NPDC050451 TaxID=3364364 RepID=UPI00378D8F29